MKRKKLKCLSAVCTAVMAVSMTAGMTMGNVPAPKTITCSTIVANASESAEISAKAFGLVTPANSVKVKRGDTTILGLEWDEFVKGSNLTVQDGTTLELEYEDGILVLDAVTREVVSNTRTSGVSREKFYITNESFSVSPMDIMTVWISKRDEDGNCFTKIGEYSSPADYGTDIDRVHNGDNSFELEFDYEENAEVVVVHNPYGYGGSLMGKFNARLNNADSNSFQSNKFPAFMKINNEWFPAENGYSSVEITNADGGSFNASTSENKGTYVYDENNKIVKVVFTAEEFAKGTGSVGRLTGDSPNKSLHIKFNYDNGDFVIYSFLGDTNNNPMFRQVYQSNRNYSQVTDGNNKPVDDNGGKTVIEGNINGKPVVSDETIKYNTEVGEYSVEVYRGAYLIEKLSSLDFEQGEYYINDYDERFNYYVRFARDNGDSVYYKYNKRLGGWVFRVDTSETPLYEIKLNTSMFPDETRTEEIKVFFGENYNNRKELLSITGEQFAEGTEKFDIATSKCDDYSIEFTDTNPADPKAESETRYYKLIGIDCEYDLSMVVPKYEKVKNNNSIFIPADKEEYPSDTLIVDGTTDDGKPVHSEVDRTTSDGYEVQLPDGEYKVSPDGEYTDTVVVKDGKTDKTEWDFSPVEQVKITGKTPDGTVIGEYMGDDFNSLSQLGLKEAIKDCPYYIIEGEKTIVNAVKETEPERLTRYAVIKDNGSDDEWEETGVYLELTFFDILEGDVNLDGKISVADLVMAQKYLLNNLDGKTNFGIENFIAFDVCRDGVGDVFDMVELRKIAVENKIK